MKRFFIVFLVIAMGVSFSSCMMMMPGHISGSMHKGHNHDSSDMKIDKVCGKEVGGKNSLTYEYQENTYYFDTEQCLSVFKSNPDHFLQKQDKDTHKKTWAKAGWIGGAVVMTSMMVLMLANVF
ncbi:MAG: YHS domain-containing protein [Bacteroidota bacterium]|nr:YHS domain-containing protein [Bacteroidota bacterium]